MENIENSVFQKVKEYKETKLKKMLDLWAGEDEEKKIEEENKVLPFLSGCISADLAKGLMTEEETLEAMIKQTALFLMFAENLQRKIGLNKLPKVANG